MKSVFGISCRPSFRVVIGDTPCHIIEVISPAGFEDFFREYDEAVGDEERILQICAKYSLEIRPETVPQLYERFGLRYGG